MTANVGTNAFATPDTSATIHMLPRDADLHELDAEDPNDLLQRLDSTLARSIPGISVRRQARSILTAIAHQRAAVCKPEIETQVLQSNRSHSPRPRTGRITKLTTYTRSGLRFARPVRQLAVLFTLVVCFLIAGGYPSAAYGQLIIEGCRLHPCDGSDPYSRADELRKEGKNQEALEAVNDAIRQDPNRGEAYGLRSGIFGNLQQYEEGVADGDKGIKLAKTPRQKAAAAYNKGFNLTYLDRKQEALLAYNLALQFNPKFAMAHFGRGKIFLFLRMWKESKAELDLSIALNPKQGAAWAYRAEAQFKLGDIQGGIVSAEKAVELAPNDPRSFQARAIGNQLTRNFDAMLADATSAVDLEPTRPLSHLLRGRAFGLLQRYDEAIAEYALEPDRKAVEPYLNGVHQAMYGTRMNNCGDSSLELEIPGGKHIDLLEDCKQRIAEELTELNSQSSQQPRKSIPNLPAKRLGKK